MPRKVSTQNDHLGTTQMTAAELPLSSDVLCLCAAAWVLRGIVTCV
jgi:hypothetical protein